MQPTRRAAFLSHAFTYITYRCLRGVRLPQACSRDSEIFPQSIPSETSRYENLNILRPYIAFCTCIPIGNSTILFIALCRTSVLHGRGRSINRLCINVDGAFNVPNSFHCACDTFKRV